MKKFSLSCPLAFLTLVAACFCGGCSESASVAGTAEEPNEFAVAESSSSEESLSSAEVGLSSSENLPHESSSSSEMGPQTQHGTRSSSSELDSSSLEFYIAKLGLGKTASYEGTLSARLDVAGDAPVNPGAAMATEFDGPWPHPFTSRNIAMLKQFFPDADKEYAGLIDSIRNGTADDSCRLYMMNVWGDASFIGHAIGSVSEDTVTVIDVASGSCKNTTEGKIVRFLFRYCGRIAMSPEIRHVVVETKLDEGVCPSTNVDDEWVK